MTENHDNVVNLFGSKQQDQAQPSQAELDKQLQETFEKQNDLIRQIVLATYNKTDEVVTEQGEVSPLVHIPIEASFSLASTYISIVANNTEEKAKEMWPMVNELATSMDKVIEEFYEKHGDDAPNEIMYYALINVAVNALHHERNMFNYMNITGESPFTGGNE